MGFSFLFGAFSVNFHKQFSPTAVFLPDHDNLVSSLAALFVLTTPQFYVPFSARGWLKPFFFFFPPLALILLVSLFPCEECLPFSAIPVAGPFPSYLAVSCRTLLSQCLHFDLSLISFFPGLFPHLRYPWEQTKSSHVSVEIPFLLAATLFPPHSLSPRSPPSTAPKPFPEKYSPIRAVVDVFFHLPFVFSTLIFSSRFLALTFIKGSLCYWAIHFLLAERPIPFFSW